MEHIKLKQSEYFLYVKIIVGVSIVPFLFDLFFGLFQERFFEHGLWSMELTYIKGAATFVQLVVCAVATAIYLHRSEKRKGCRDKFWMILGGPIAFVGYVLWGIHKHCQLVLPEEHSLLSASKMIMEPIRRDP